MTQREQEIDNIINSIKTQKQWEDEKNTYVNKMYKIYNKELEDYNFIKNHKQYDNMELGGYVRYIDGDDNLKWGGILIKKYKKHEFNYMILANSNMQRLNVSYNRNTCFYKKHKTASDNRRQLFMSYLDKIPE